jgi:sterol 24-C-methyltransferase
MTAGTKTQYGDSDRDLSKLMHGKSSDDRNSFFSMLSKDHESHRAITDAYVGHWGDKNGDAKTEEARDKRKGEYMNIVNK